MGKPRSKKPLYLYPANIMFKALSRIGMSLGAINVLTVAGRVSGRPHSTPVSPVLLNGRRFVIAPVPQADWARNARAAGRGQLTNGRRTKPVILRELGDPDLRRAVMTAFPAAVPHGVRLFKALGLVNGATQTNLPLPPTTLLPSKSCLHQPLDALPIHRRQADRPPERKWRRGTRPRTPGERVSLSAGAPSANPATSWQQPSAYYKGEPP